MNTLIKYYVLNCINSEMLCDLKKNVYNISF